MPLKITLAALLALATPALADQVDTQAEIEETTDTDIDGDGCIEENGVCVASEDD